ncbi:MAG: MarR family transcriptional regulator [Phycisphaerales bacterium]|nr:MAG: MarR family transcriptional regulator [Phycisphaerales bacterium]
MVDIHGIAGQIARIREKANALVDSELKRRGIKGIVPAHGPALFFLLQQSEPVPIKAVVENIGRAKSTVTVMVDTLERYGYLRKLPCQTDNRMILVELTAAGRKLRKDFDQISEGLLGKLYGDMNQKDRQLLVRQLTIIEANLSQ